MFSARGRAVVGGALLTVPAALGFAVAAAPGLAAGAGPVAHAASAAPVPCTSIGGGEYNCQFYVAGNGSTGGAPVENSSGTRVGYLNEGTNFVYCQHTGSKVTSGSDYNVYWAYTEADNLKKGWVNAVWASGGDNDGDFEGVPTCPSSDGLPPGGTATTTTTTTPTTTTRAATTTTTKSATTTTAKSTTTTTPPTTVTTTTPGPTVTTTTPAPPASTTTVVVTAPPVKSPGHPSHHRHLRADIGLRWHLSGDHTTLLGVQFERLHGKVGIRLRCVPGSCPFGKKSLDVDQAEKAMTRTFKAGAVLDITITRRGFVPEVATIEFRDNKGPLGQIISR